MAEIGRENADTVVEVVVETKSAAENGGVRAEGTAPQAIADDSGSGESEGVVLSSEQAADLRLCAQERKVIRADDEQLEALRLLGAGEVHADGPSDADVSEH